MAMGESEPRFAPGMPVRWRGRNSEGTVQRVRHLAGEVHYLVDFGGGLRRTVREDDLDPVVLDPVDRLLTGDLEPASDFALRVTALRLVYAYAYDGAVCLSNSRLEPLPHQIFVAHRAIQRLAPRLLLADEVGLGKTIEAGLILKELRARGLVKRALIITPANLVDQWRWELRNKFNEAFVSYTRARIDDLRFKQPQANPWLAEDNIICSHNLVTYRERPDRQSGGTRDRRKSIAEEIAEVEWDIVIIDEAHHMRRRLSGGEQKSTLAYQVAEQVSRHAHALLLLTATPMQLDDYEMYSLIELLDPTVFPTYDDFRWYNRTTGRDVNRVVAALQQWPDLDLDEREAVAEECGRMLPETDVHTLLRTPVGIEECGRRLSDLHRLSGVMVRNRKRVIGGFADRAAELIDVEMTPLELELYERVSRYVQEQYNLAQVEDNRALGFVMATFQRMLASSSHALAEALARRRDRLAAALKGAPTSPSLSEPIAPDFDEDDEGEELPGSLAGLISYRSERWRQDMVAEIEVLDDLVQLARSIPCDSKLQLLSAEISRMLREDPRTKVLIFTTFRDTQEYVRRALAHVCEVAVFHGEMDQRRKDEEVERFRNGAPVLISTESGGEGRNFQFCHVLYNYDLPWNPMRVEQRIGRVDRIGQQHQVRIYNFAAPATIEGRIIARLHERIHLFEQAVGGLDPILDGTITRQIERISLGIGGQSDEDLDRMAEEITVEIKRAREREEHLRDFVMDLSSFRRDEADRLLNRSPEVTNSDLQQFVIDALKRYPTVESPRSFGDGLWRVTVPRVLGDRLRQPVFEPATFDPKTALRNERADFLAFGHPLVDTLIGECQDPDFGTRATIRYLDAPDFAGFEGLQIVYTVEYSGIRPIQRLHCVVVDRDGRSDPEIADRILRAPDGAMPSPLSRAELSKNSAPPPAPARIKAIWEDDDDAPETSNDLCASAPLAGSGRGGIVRLGDDPELIQHCRELADEALYQRIEQERVDMASENARLYDDELRKAERIHAYRIAKAEQEMRSQLDTLERFEASPDPDIRRIIPVYRGRVDAARQAIVDADRDYQEQIAELTARKDVTYSSTVECVAVAYGPIAPTPQA